MGVMTALAVFAASLSCVCTSRIVASPQATAVPLHSCCQSKQENGKPIPAKDESCNHCREDRIAQSSAEKSLSPDHVCCVATAISNDTGVATLILDTSTPLSHLNTNHQPPTLLQLHCAHNC